MTYNTLKSLTLALKVLSNVEKAFSSRPIQGRLSSLTWYGLTWTYMVISNLDKVSSSPLAVIQVFFPPAWPPSSQYIASIRFMNLSAFESEGVNVLV